MTDILKLRWGEVVTRSLGDGLDGWCEHGAFAAAGGRLFDVIRTTRRLGGAVAWLTPDHDFVHPDLSTKNALTEATAAIHSLCSPAEAG